MQTEIPDARPAIGTKAWIRAEFVWKVQTIPVCWETDVPSAPTERRWVQDAVARTWEASSQVRFVGWNACTNASKGVRVTVGDFVTRTLGVGTELDGVPSGMRLNFTFDDWSPWCKDSASARESCLRANAVHEFGHALGFVHEQNRHDTPGSCAEAPSGPDGDTILTSWDPVSMMNYCNADRMRHNGALSDGDKLGVAAIYGPPAKP